jgi:hypothetical protein
MIQLELSLIEDLTASLGRCRQQLSNTDNANARDIYERVIGRYETLIAKLSVPPLQGARKAKPAKQ